MTGPIAHGGRAPWRRRFAMLFALGVLVAAPIMARAQGADSVALVWSAPGDDGNVGTATVYDLRLSSAPITLGNWDAATPVPGLPAPQVAGTSQEVMVRGLTQGTVYYFAIRTRDDSGNWSGVSNVLRWDWIIDAAPPGAPDGLQADASGRTVTLQWNAGPEPDLTGYTVYRAITIGGPYARLTDTLLVTPQYVDDTVPSGWTGAAYRVTATDASGNESAQSAAATVSFSTAGSPPPPTLAIEPPYPNPSGGQDAVNIPIVLPPTGALGALVDVLDSGGHRVRRLALSGYGSGPQAVVWDGRNDAGRAVAPGVYTAVLIVGPDRQRTKLVRQP